VAAANTGTFADYDDGVTITASSGTVTQDNGHGTWSWSGTGDEDSPYSVTITATNADGSTATTSFQVTFTDSQLTNTAGVDVSATEGAPLSGVVVATFTDPAGSGSLGEYSVTIDWGDQSGTDATGTIQDLGNGQFQVLASHTYAEEGSYNVSVSITHNLLSAVTATSTAFVDDASLDSTGVTPLSAKEGTSTGPVVLATFTDDNPGDHSADFSIAINWGDSTDTDTSSGKVSYNPSTGVYTVTGSHTYLTPTGSALDTITVDVSDVGGAATGIQDYISVTNVSPKATSISGPASGTPGQTLSSTAFTVIMATSPVLEDVKLVFSDPTVEQHFALVNWGDGHFNVYDLGVSGGGFFSFRHRYSRHTNIKKVVVHVYLFDAHCFLGAQLGEASAAYHNPR
jgi:hypothetical protein